MLPTRKRFERSLDLKRNILERPARVMEHLEKVFLCHIHLPKTSEKDVSELVQIYAKEFGVEDGAVFDEYVSEKAPTTPQEVKVKLSSDSPDVNTFVLSFAEVYSIQIALPLYISRNDEAMTPRLVRSFLFRYQTVRMILQLNKVNYGHEDLAEELATAVAKARRLNSAVDEKPESQLHEYGCLNVCHISL